MNQIEQALIFIAAAVIAVPIAKRFGFGSVLGYLGAGVLIGPAALGLISDVEYVLHFAELGVVFLLFIIGLELKPARLWVLRRQVFGFGTLQVVVTGVLLALMAMWIGEALRPAIVIGFGLALSSTAFVLQMLAERRQLTSLEGRSAFAILLFQDLAVIPLIALIPMLAVGGEGLKPLQALFGLLAVVGLIIGGRYLLRPVLRLVARTEIKELFTATALLVVLGSAVLMERNHLSMGLGAFIAGMLLADSEYRHELETNIEPFKGLLLGLFFIAVGMSVDLSLIASRPVDVLGFTALLIITKAIVIFGLARMLGFDTRESRSLAVILAQGGEFAFVLFTIARENGVLPTESIELLIVVVTLSMACTPLLYLLNEQLANTVDKSASEPQFDEIDDESNPVIIASFGRFGQIVGRILKSRGIAFTALESSVEQVEVVRHYGNKVYYGDAGRIDLLRAAGADKARFFILAIDDMEQSLRVARTVRHYFPNLPILARARNRFHAHLLMDLGIKSVYRDTFYSGLELTKSLLISLGNDEDSARNIVETFADHDEELLHRQHAFRQDESRMRQTAHDAAEELESLLRADARNQNERTDST